MAICFISLRYIKKYASNITCTNAPFFDPSLMIKEETFMRVTEGYGETRSSINEYISVVLDLVKSTDRQN